MLEEDKRGILLESGTNEIEVMEFTINENLYGINVAKVREIIMNAPVKAMPHAHPAVEGIFKPRDLVLTVVDLPQYLLGAPCEKGPKDLFIITNFNKMNITIRWWASAASPGGISKSRIRPSPEETRAWPPASPSAAATW